MKLTLGQIILTRTIHAINFMAGGGESVIIQVYATVQKSWLHATVYFYYLLYALSICVN